MDVANQCAKEKHVSPQQGCTIFRLWSQHGNRVRSMGLTCVRMLFLSHWLRCLLHSCCSWMWLWPLWGQSPKVETLKTCCPSKTGLNLLVALEPLKVDGLVSVALWSACIADIFWNRCSHPFTGAASINWWDLLRLDCWAVQYGMLLLERYCNHPVGFIFPKYSKCRPEMKTVSFFLESVYHFIDLSWQQFDMFSKLGFDCTGNRWAFQLVCPWPSIKSTWAQRSLRG